MSTLKKDQKKRQQKVITHCLLIFFVCLILSGLLYLIGSETAAAGLVVIGLMPLFICGIDRMQKKTAF